MDDATTTEAAADCKNGSGGLAAGALAGEASEFYRPLTVGTTPGGPDRFGRDEVAAALVRANLGWGHPRANELGRLLADPTARVVVTGQQPGLFGGPLLTLLKALTASAWAERLSDAGRPALAVFWIAGEDHDFREIAQASWLEGNELRREPLGEDDAPLEPVGSRLLGGAIEVLLAQWADSLETDFWRAEASRLARHFTPQVTFTDGFASYLIETLGDRAPLFLDAQDQEIKNLQRPLLERLVTDRAAVQQSLAKREAEIRKAGWELQVPSRPDTLPLFVHSEGMRRRVLRREEGFALAAEDPARPWQELQRAIASAPQSVSPSALARPVIQDALLGTNLFVVGPSELAYLAQAAPLYDLFGIEPPALAVRPSVALAARRKLEQVEAIGVPLGELAAGAFDSEAFLAARAGSNPVQAVAAQFAQRLEALQGPLAAIDPSLEGPLAKTDRAIAQSIEKLESKVAASMARSDQVNGHRLAELDSLLVPGGLRQERALTTAWALGRFGSDLPERIARALNLEPGRMQVIPL